MTTDLYLEDLVPRPRGGRRGAPPCVLAASAERLVLEQLLSIGLTAQARLMRAKPADAAGGWSPAEEGSYRAARAMNLLTLSAQRLLKAYRDDFAFDTYREYAEADADLRVDHLAARALVSTDSEGRHNAYVAREKTEEMYDEIREVIFENTTLSRAYQQATLDKLRLYEPDWVTREQFAAARAAAEQAAAEPTVERAPDPPDPIRAGREAASAELTRQRIAFEARQAAERENAKTAKRVDGLDDSPPTTSGAPAAEPVDPLPPKRRRGAQKGNGQTLKTGRHTAEAKAIRAEGRQMMADVRELGREIDALIAQHPSRAAGKPKMEPAPS